MANSNADGSGLERHIIDLDRHLLHSYRTQQERGIHILAKWLEYLDMRPIPPESEFHAVICSNDCQDHEDLIGFVLNGMIVGLNEILSADVADCLADYIRKYIRALAPIKHALAIDDTFRNPRIYLRESCRRDLFKVLQHLLTVREDKTRDPEDIDCIISAIFIDYCGFMIDDAYFVFSWLPKLLAKLEMFNRSEDLVWALRFCLPPKERIHHKVRTANHSSARRKLTKDIIKCLTARQDFQYFIIPYALAFQDYTLSPWKLDILIAGCDGNFSPELYLIHSAEQWKQIKDTVTDQNSETRYVTKCLLLLEKFTKKIFQAKPLGVSHEAYLSAQLTAKTLLFDVVDELKIRLSENWINESMAIEISIEGRGKNLKKSTIAYYKAVSCEHDKMFKKYSQLLCRLAAGCNTNCEHIIDKFCLALVTDFYNLCQRYNIFQARKSTAGELKTAFDKCMRIMKLLTQLLSYWRGDIKLNWQVILKAISYVACAKNLKLRALGCELFTKLAPVLGCKGFDEFEYYRCFVYDCMQRKFIFTPKQSQFKAVTNLYRTYTKLYPKDAYYLVSTLQNIQKQNRTIYVMIISAIIEGTEKTFWKEPTRKLLFICFEEDKKLSLSALFALKKLISLKIPHLCHFFYSDCRFIDILINWYRNTCMHMDSGLDGTMLVLIENILCELVSQLDWNTQREISNLNLHLIKTNLTMIPRQCFWENYNDGLLCFKEKQRQNVGRVTHSVFDMFIVISSGLIRGSEDLDHVDLMFFKRVMTAALNEEKDTIQHISQSLFEFVLEKLLNVGILEELLEVVFKEYHEEIERHKWRKVYNSHVIHVVNSAGKALIKREDTMATKLMFKIMCIADMDNLDLSTDGTPDENKYMFWESVEGEKLKTLYDSLLTYVEEKFYTMTANESKHLTLKLVRTIVALPGDLFCHLFQKVSKLVVCYLRFVTTGDLYLRHLLDELNRVIEFEDVISNEEKCMLLDGYIHLTKDKPVFFSEEILMLQNYGITMLEKIKAGILLLDCSVTFLQALRLEGN